MTKAAPEVSSTNERDLSSLQDEIQSIHLTSTEKDVIRARVIDFTRQPADISPSGKETQTSRLRTAVILLIVAVGIVSSLVVLKTDVAQPLISLLSASLLSPVQPSKELNTPPPPVLPSDLTHIKGGALSFAVSTDKPSYTTSEPIRITVTLANPSDTPIVLDFPSSCQASYHIDTVGYGGEICAQVLTKVTVAPKKNYEWTFTHTVPLTLGSHTIAGEIRGQGISKTTRISVR